MALFGFGKKNGDGGGEDNGQSGDDGKGFSRSLRKANTFFDYGDTAADSKNFDYAVECYIGGLRHDPDNMERHEKLHEIAKRRSVNGGKPMKVKPVGPSLVDKMLTAEKAWALDWNNVGHMVKTMEAAVDADQRGGEAANLAEVAYWAGSLAIDYNANSKTDRKAYIAIIDAMEKIEGFDKALDAARRALSIKDEDSLRDRIKDLTAQNYTKQSANKEDGGGFRSNIKDADEQARIQAELDTTGSQTDKLIAAMREQYEESPEDYDKLQKLVDALLRPEDNEHDKEAVTLLLKAYEQTGQYRYKMKAGDVKIKNYGRVLRQLADAVKQGNEQAKPKYQEGLKRRLAFELQEYAERVQNYPTDLKLKFELGKRQYQASRFDDAIGNFQQAKSEPKSRAMSHLYLSRCFMQKEWIDEAVSTLVEGIAQHPPTDDTLAKEMRYDLMVAKMGIAKKNNDAETAKQAQQLASELLQTDINYKDIRQKMDEIKKLLDELK